MKFHRETLVRAATDRMFRSLYKYRLLRVSHATWFHAAGGVRHVIALTDATNGEALKRWEWIEEK